MKFFLLAVLVCLAIYLMCRSGATVTKSIAAVLFVFRRSKNADNVSVSSCTGWVRHALRLQEGKTCEFHLDAQSPKGDIAISLLDGKKQTLLRITPYLPDGSIRLSGSVRYYLHWEFKHASGKFALSWREV